MKRKGWTRVKIRKISREFVKRKKKATCLSQLMGGGGSVRGEGIEESKDDLLGEKKYINRVNDGMGVLFSLQEERKNC